MHKSLITAAGAGVLGTLLLAAPLASARDNVSWSVNIGAPVATYPVYAPAYSQPPVVYAAPAPFYVQQAPVYYAPPVVVAPPYYGRVYYNTAYPQPYYREYGHYHHGYGHGNGYGGPYRHER
ncbi:MAG: hypothetical protein H7327_06230 [Herminiimonas sp.]|nr:hypothetical protein [Herminiimonas sp.]